MNNHTNNGELPYGFVKWFDFYTCFNWKEIKPDDTIEWDVYGKNGYHKFTYTQDYLKARCFDEVMAYDFTIQELHDLSMAIHQFGYSNSSVLTNKIGALLRIRHELEYAEKMRIP